MRISRGDQATGKASKRNYGKKGEFSEWAYAGLQEACDKVASEDVGRLSIAQDIVRKSTDFLRIILALVSGVGSVTLCDVYLHRNMLPSGGLHMVGVIGAW